MFCWILLSILLLSSYQSDICSNTCWYAFDNKTGDNHGTTDRPRLGIFTTLWDKGKEIHAKTVITVNGSFSVGACKPDIHYDFLQFVYWGGSYRDWRNSKQIISFKVEPQKWTIFGEKDDGGSLASKELIGSWKTDGDLMLIQISSVKDGAYDVHLNDNNWQYDYNGNWDSFNGLRLNRVNNIQSYLTCTSYRYIMICDNAMPAICFTEEPTETLVLGQNYTLNCTGTGSPVLTLDWNIIYELEEKTPFRKNAKQVVETSRPDVISSTLTIANFSVYDIGSYSCHVKNKKYGGITTKYFSLIYNETYTSIPPTDIFYSSEDKDLVWNITGWPLNDTILSCKSIIDNQGKDIEDPVNITTHNQYLNNPPLKIFLIPTSYPQLKCRLHNTTSTISTRTFTRIGYNCISGYYGRLNGSSLECLLCPTGTTNLAQSGGINSCLKVVSDCKVGEYGVEKCNCCPFGMVTGCHKCPGKNTSLAGSVKVEECYRANNDVILFAGAGGGRVAAVIVIVLILICK